MVGRVHPVVVASLIVVFALLVTPDEANAQTVTDVPCEVDCAEQAQAVYQECLNMVLNGFFQPTIT